MQTNFPQKVFQALIDPRRSQEFLGWLQVKKNAEEKMSLVNAWRGETGETLMHWAFLSSWSIALELNNLGLSYYDKDNLGRTPMDWLTDRLWGGVINDFGKTKLSTAGKERLVKQTEEQIKNLLSLGININPDNEFNDIKNNKIYPPVAWVRAGAWDLVYFYEKMHKNMINWPPVMGSALHVAILSPDTPQRRQFFKFWGDNHDLNVRDEDGRTALWYAVEAALSNDEWFFHLTKVIGELIENGASATEEDKWGISPAIMVAHQNDVLSKKYLLAKTMKLVVD